MINMTSDSKQQCIIEAYCMLPITRKRTGILLSCSGITVPLNGRMRTCGIPFDSVTLFLFFPLKHIRLSPDVRNAGLKMRQAFNGHIFRVM